MAYGTLKVDNITYTSAGVDATTTVSGLVGGNFPNIAITGTISGATITGNTGEFTTITAVTGIFTATLSGATVTGVAAQFTNVTGGAAGFTTVTGQTVTGTAGQFGTVTGNTAGFTTITGQTVTGTAGQFGTVTGNTAGFTTVTGQTVTGSVAQFINITGNAAGFTTITGATVTGSAARFVSANFTTSITGTTVTGTTSSFTTGVVTRLGLNIASPTSTIDIDGNYTQTVEAVGALNIDCSTGNYFTKTISSSSSFTVSNVPASRAYAFTLEITHTSGTITWFSGVEWPGGTAPTLTTGKTHLFMFVTDDGGTRWRASSLINYTN